MKYDLNVFTNYICINFKYKKMPAQLFYLLPRIYQENIKNAKHKIIKSTRKKKNTTPHEAVLWY